MHLLLNTDKNTGVTLTPPPGGSTGTHVHGCDSLPVVAGVQSRWRCAVAAGGAPLGQSDSAARRLSGTLAADGRSHTDRQERLTGDLGSVFISAPEMSHS